MAMIPPDVGVRLRMPGDTGLPPTSTVREVPADLPEFQPGKMFTARIQDVLPENTYRALVAGRQMTLSLPEGAKAGDTLELIVVDRTPQMIVARQATQSGTALPPGADPHTTLSPTAQIIGQLLKEQPPSVQAQLSRGAPMLPTAPGQLPQGSTQLATALAQSVANSGMFYESHQAQWVAGKRPLQALFEEPQSAFGTARPAAESATGATTQPAQQTASTAATLKADTAETAASATGTKAAETTNPTSIPDELRPLVHQQLEAAATQRLIWHGEVWPGQTMDWEIQEEDPRKQDEEGEPAGWNTSLRLSTPRLGKVEAQLRLSGDTLQINLSTPYGATAADLRDGLPALSDALAAKGVLLTRATVRHDNEEEG